MVQIKRCVNVAGEDIGLKYCCKKCKHDAIINNQNLLHNDFGIDACAKDNAVMSEVDRALGCTGGE